MQLLSWKTELRDSSKTVPGGKKKWGERRERQRERKKRRKKSDVKRHGG